MIASGEVDVISVLTPPAARADILFPAAAHGVHVLVEKPFAENMADAVGFVEAARTAGTVLAVNQSLRFMPDILEAKHIIEGGAVGEVRYAEHGHYQNRTRTKGWRTNEERLEISIFSIHILDRVRWLVGRMPRAVSAVTRHWSDDVRGETFAALTIQFEGGAVGTMNSNWHSLELPECRLRIDGTAGSITSAKRGVAADEMTLTLKRVGEEAASKVFSEEKAARNGMGRSMEELLAATTEGRQPHHSGKDNLQTMAVVDAAYLSASREGQLVEIAEVWPGASAPTDHAVSAGSGRA
jgi:predicted dehydrogenase